MKEVKTTAQPSFRQMLNMASNLQEKFDKFSTLDFHAVNHSVDKDAIGTYRLYVEDKYHRMDISSWQELQDKYFGLMDGNL